MIINDIKRINYYNVLERKKWQMHIYFSLHRDHSHRDLVGRISHEVGAALDWLTGPAMTDQERTEQTLADAHNQRFGDSAL